MAIIHDEEWLKNHKLKVLWFKTFGGLEREYYWRHFCICAAFFVFYILFNWTGDKHGIIDNTYLFWSSFYCLILCFLYPYARFFFDEVWHFILRLIFGEDIIIYNINIIFFIFKLFRIIFCAMASPILAPIALIYIYIYHSIGIRKYLKEQRELEAEAASYAAFMRWQQEQKAGNAGQSAPNSAQYASEQQDRKDSDYRSNDEQDLKSFLDSLERSLYLSATDNKSDSSDSDATTNSRSSEDSTNSTDVKDCNESVDSLESHESDKSAESAEFTKSDKPNKS